MKLKQYLIESRSVKLDRDDAIYVLQHECSNTLYDLEKGIKPPIYRGLENHAEYLEADPTTGSPRISKNTSNHTTLMMDNLPLWSKYPKRSRSLICSTDHRYAMGFGSSLYRVIPYDKCTYGVVPGEDVWVGFKTMNRMGVEEFNDSLIFLISQVFNKRFVSDNSWSTLKATLIKASKILNDNFDGVRVMEVSEAQKDFITRKYIGQITIRSRINIISAYLDTKWDTKGKVDLMQFVTDIINPVTNGFKTTLSNSDKNNEVWIGNAPCILVREDIYQRGMNDED